MRGELLGYPSRLGIVEIQDVEAQILGSIHRLKVLSGKRSGLIRDRLTG
jgi:hypothetical protein